MTLAITGISRGLGLAEVTADANGGFFHRVWAVVTPADGVQRSLVVPLVPGPERVDVDAAGRPGAPRVVWTARLHLPPPAGGSPPGTTAGEPERVAMAEVFGVRTDAAGRGDGPAERVGTIDVTTEPAAHQHTPDWAKGAVWYQVFVERFRNGEPGNDPRGADVFLKPWGARWDEVGLDELDAARAASVAADRPARSIDVFRSVVFRRRYGGDLPGVVERLDHLSSMGVDGLYLTPIFRAPSLHKYDASDYRHVDETFGPAATSASGAGRDDDSAPDDAPADDPAAWRWTPADRYLLDTLLPAARQRGLRVMLDGVWNHTGRAFWAFRDLLARGTASPYADWYDATFVGPEGWHEPHLPLKPGDLATWRGWDGRGGNLPAFRQTERRDLAPGPKAHIFDITRRWMTPDGDPAGGIDGWRLDVAGEIGLPFWLDWHRLVKTLNPEALTIAELWYPAPRFFGADAAAPRGPAGPRGFDGQMNYPFARAVVGWLGQRPGMTSAQAARELEAVFVNHPATDLVQMNLLCSHDTDRLASMLHNPGVPYDAGLAPNAPAGTDGRRYRADRPPRETFERAVVGMTILATAMGSPTIYAGEELGMFGADDPHCRKPLPWPDLPAPDDPDDAAQPWVTDSVRAAFRLRHDAETGPLLRWGLMRMVDSGRDDVLVFERRLNARVAIVVANRGDAPFEAAGVLADVAAARRVLPGGGAEGSRVEPRSAGVWIGADSTVVDDIGSGRSRP